MIGDTLKSLREKTKLSQRAFAEKYDINQSTLASYELGKREPNIDMLIRFSRIYGVSVDYLVGNDIPGFADYKITLDKYGCYGNDLHESFVQMLNAGINIKKSAKVFEAIIYLKDCIRNLDTAMNTSFNNARDTVKQRNIPLLNDISSDGSPTEENGNPSNMLYMLSFMSAGIESAILAKNELSSLLDTILKEFSLDLLNLRFRLASTTSDAEQEGDNGNSDTAGRKL